MAGKNQNVLRDEDIDKIVKAFKKFKTVEKYSYRATVTEIVEAEFNLNIPRYVDTFEEEEEINVVEVQKEIMMLESELVETKKTIDKYLKALGL